MTAFCSSAARSVYAYEDELKRGYFTVQGGCRIGVAGCRGPGGFSAVTSLNLRIARWLTCPLPSELEAYIATPGRGLLLAARRARQNPHCCDLLCKSSAKGRPSSASLTSAGN